MQRREVLNTLAIMGATVPAAMLSGAADGAPLASRSTTTPTTSPFISARDGTQLYWTQWGSGRPILFLNSFGLTTQMWEYPIIASADQGYRWHRLRSTRTRALRVSARGATTTIRSLTILMP